MGQFQNNHQCLHRACFEYASMKTQGYCLPLWDFLMLENFLQIKQTHARIVVKFLMMQDITIANIYHSNRNLSKVYRAPQKDRVCVAISAIVVGRLDFKERAFYFCGVLTVLSLLHTRSYWLNICLQSKGDFEKSRSPNLLYFSACAVEASETHFSGIDRYIFPERGGIEELEDCTCIKICYLISPPPS